MAQDRAVFLDRDGVLNAIVMRDGKICEQGTTEKLFCAPEHPYTVELLESIPDIADVRAGRRLGPGGSPTC